MRHKYSLVSTEQLTTHLNNNCSKKDCQKETIGEYAGEHIPLSMNLSRIYLIKDLHQNESVENYCKMLRWRSAMWLIKSIWNIEKHVAVEGENEHDDELVKAVTENVTHHGTGN